MSPHRFRFQFAWTSSELIPIDNPGLHSRVDFDGYDVIWDVHLYRQRHREFAEFAVPGDDGIRNVPVGIPQLLQAGPLPAGITAYLGRWMLRAPRDPTRPFQIRPINIRYSRQTLVARMF